METAFSKEFKKTVLLAFTRELILHSEKKEIVQLQDILITEQRKKEEIHFLEKEIILLKEIISSEEQRKHKKLHFLEREAPVKKEFITRKEIPVRKINDLPQQMSPILEKKIAVAQIRQITKQIVPPKEQVQKKIAPKPKMERLTIPEARLPQYLEYLKPTLVSNKTEIDWEKLNPLIRDNAVRVIEANPDEKVKVSGSMGRKSTNIIFNAQEIDEIINKFASLSRIPASEGVYKVVVENLIFFAVISNVVGSRFVIQKMQPQQVQNAPQTNLQRKY